MTTLRVTIWLNEDDQAAGRGYCPGDQLTEAAQVSYGFIAPDRHDSSELRLHLPDQVTWPLNRSTMFRIAARVLAAVQGQGEPWEHEAVAGHKPVKLIMPGDVFRIDAPGEFEQLPGGPVWIARDYLAWNLIEEPRT